MGIQTISRASNVSNGDIPKREVLKCATCGLVQYRTRKNRCPRCAYPLPIPTNLTGLLALFASPNPEADGETCQKISNHEAVKNIGQRISVLCELRRMSRRQLQKQSGVSRSYISKIEAGQLIPSLGTLEKIADAFCVGFHIFFVPENELLLEDPFILEISTFLNKLSTDAWWSILKSLQAIQPKQNERAVT